MMEGGEAMPDLARVSRLLADAYRLLSDQSLGNGELAVAMKLLTETEATEQTRRMTARPPSSCCGASLASPTTRRHGGTCAPSPAGNCCDR
jgi:hypothetical protein